MNRKPRILLIPNVAWWIIGEMGRQIVARFGDKYDFYFVPEGLLERRPDLLDTLVASVDVIHCLNESSIDLFRGYDIERLPPISTWIHHITTLSPMHRLAIEKSTALNVCTEGWKQYMEQCLDVRMPITVVPHGVDAKVFHRVKLKPGTFGIPAGKFVVGFIGNKGSDSDQGRKGTDVFFDVILRTNSQVKNLHVVLGGPGWDTEMRGLAAQGISANATGYVHKSELPALYSALDAYLLTSRVEGGPCTVFEAMACETAVVSTRVGAVPDLITDGVNGYSVEVDDAGALVAALVALSESAEMRRTLGSKARETVVKLPWGKALTPLEAVYDSLVQLGKGPALNGLPWMDDPRSLMRVSSAADALSNVMKRVRQGKLNVAQGLKLLPEMLQRKSVGDVVKGFAMLRGWTYKASASSSSREYRTLPGR